MTQLQRKRAKSKKGFDNAVRCLANVWGTKIGDLVESTLMKHQKGTPLLHEGEE